MTTALGFYIATIIVTAVLCLIFQDDLPGDTYAADLAVGEIAQEVGGLSVTLLAFGAAAQLSVDTCEQNEVERVLSKPPEYFAERNKLKNAAGFKAT